MLARLSNRPGRRFKAGGGGGGGGSPTLLTLDKLVYRGAYHVNYVGIPGEHRFGRGLAFREVPEDVTEPKHLLSTSSGSSAGSGVYAVYETRVATPSIGTGYDPSQYTSVNAIKVYGTDPYTDAAAVNLMGADDLQGDHGIGWDDTDERIHWSYSDGYNSNYGTVGWGSLDYAGETGEGHGRFLTNNPAGFKPISAGMVAIPAWFATAYLSGKRVCLWSGRNQSVVTKEDMSEGLALTAIDPLPTTGAGLTITDAATPGAGSATMTSVAGGFAALQVGDRIMGSGTGANWTYGQYYIEEIVNDNEITLTSSPTPLGAGSSGTFWAARIVNSLPLMGSWPYYESSGAGRGRMGRPAGSSLVFQYVDSWELDKYTWTDYIEGVAWVDFTYNGTHYHGIFFVGTITQHAVGYVGSDVVLSAQRGAIGIVDPMDLAPVTGGNYYDVQPAEFDWLDIPTVDQSLYQLSDPQVVTGITSNAAKHMGENDGCLVQCTGHGYSEGQGISVDSSDVSEYNNLWRVHLNDADSFYIYNPTLAGTPWSGTASSNAETRTRANSARMPGIMGMAFDPDTRYLYIRHAIDYGVGPDARQVLDAVYEIVLP